MQDRPEYRFACDAMLKGLARWLRAYGYDASWTYGIDDQVLLEQARREGRIVLTADGGILRLRSVRRGDPPGWKVGHEKPPLQQLQDLVKELGLARKAIRCMGCGGELKRVPKQSVREEAPPRTFAWLDEFYRCLACGQLFWPGTHYRRIQQQLKFLELE
ncbi:MAG: hypothetical protein DWQ01_13515 [Planctomycetota bacterium]|nr:MAG: hypothetical protein DWQ01_13515 [Planctomycetota bacterium]